MIPDEINEDTVDVKGTVTRCLSAILTELVLSPLTSVRHNGPRKQHKCCVASSLLPSLYIFCDRRDRKISDKTERLTNFALKHAWDKIKDNVQQLGNY